jgi:hypothetical protein
VAEEEESKEGAREEIQNEVPLGSIPLRGREPFQDNTGGTFEGGTGVGG